MKRDLNIIKAILEAFQKEKYDATEYLSKEELFIAFVSLHDTSTQTYLPIFIRDIQIANPESSNYKVARNSIEALHTQYDFCFDSHLCLCRDAGFIEFNVSNTNEPSIRLTWEGYEYLDKLRTH